MIYTLTLNPSVDYIVSVDPFELGKTNRTTEEMKNPGGKGINVSKVLQNLHIESKALGFIGGFTGSFIETALKNENIATDFIEIDGDTRINVKLKTTTETEVNGQSPTITTSHIEHLKRKLNVLQKGDFLVLAGSVPDSLPASFYATLMEELKATGAYMVVDTSGEALSESIEANPFLIKPNENEIAEMFGCKNVTKEQAVNFGKQLIKKGVQNIIISMAGRGALFLNDEKVLFANVPKGKVRNSVGAGDSVVAGFIASYVQEKNVEEAFRNGIAAGSASAFSDGFCTKETIHELKQQIKVELL